MDQLTVSWTQVADIDFCILVGANGAARRGHHGRRAWLLRRSDSGVAGRTLGHAARLGKAARVHYQRLRPRIGALCDIPDLELFPARYPGSQSVMFRAALEIGISQRGLAAIGALRRMGLIKRPEKLAAFLNRSADLLDPFGSALGGMVVRVRGLDGAGAPAQAAWHIAADDDHGPEIPCMAAVLLARRIAA
ncbi:hypothetical protein LP419_24780 [Massilia sp. H-1]|nr:hypothetical protein LP419_24780 [Massilia sp. H-1]